MAHHVAKFHWGTPFTPKATGMHNFGPLLKNCKGTPAAVEGVLVRLVIL